MARKPGSRPNLLLRLLHGWRWRKYRWAMATRNTASSAQSPVVQEWPIKSLGQKCPAGLGAWLCDGGGVVGSQQPTKAKVSCGGRTSMGKRCKHHITDGAASLEHSRSRPNGFCAFTIIFLRPKALGFHHLSSIRASHLPASISRATLVTITSIRLLHLMNGFEL